MTETSLALRDKLTDALANPARDGLSTESGIAAIELLLSRMCQLAGTLEVSLEVVAILSAELDRLEWIPFSGVKFIAAVLRTGVQSTAFVQTAKIYLSLYFEEQDERLALIQEWLDLGPVVDGSKLTALLSEAVNHILESYGLEADV